MKFHASAPATLMLMGEHAVLHKKFALVCTLNRRIRVRLSPRPDSHICIDSVLGCYQTGIEMLSIEKPFQFVLAALLSVKKHLKTGCDIHIESEFSDQVGLGSSAAVTVAIISALHQWLGLPLDPESLILPARAVVRTVQGLGSGADVAASVLGGTVLYRAEPIFFEKLQFNPKLCAVYSGSKMPTKEVIDIVEARRAKQPDVFDRYFSEIDSQVLKAKEAIDQQDWNKLAQCFKANQGLMQKLGVSNSHLEKIIQSMEADAGIIAAKISGSGLGDCIIGLGKLKTQAFPDEIPIELSEQGVIYDAK